MSQYFPPYRSSGRNIKMDVDLISYATKTDIKNVTFVDVDIVKLTPAPNDLAKLSNVVKNDVVKKTVCDKLIAKVNNIDTTGFALQTKYNTDKSNLEKKIFDAEKRIPNISGLQFKITVLKLLK